MRLNMLENRRRVVKSFTPEDFFDGYSNITLKVKKLRKSDTFPILFAKIYRNGSPFVFHCEICMECLHGIKYGKVRLEDVIFVETEGFRHYARVRRRKGLIERIVNLRRK